MKKFLLLLVITSLNHVLCHAQKNSISCQIVDENGIGIPFAAVGIVEKNFGTVTFEDGTFKLDIIEEYMYDSLVISAVGFQRKKLSYLDFVTQKPIKIELKESTLILNEITVVPSKMRYSKLGTTKNNSPNNFSIASPLKGATVVMLFDEVKSPLLIQEISVVIGKKNMDTYQLRCRIFMVDSVSDMPGDDLYNKNLIQIGKEETETLMFSLEEDFWVDQPFFVGFEWVASKEQFEELQKAEDAFDTSFLGEIIANNSELSYTIRNNETVRFRDSDNQIVKEVKLNEEQTKILNDQNAAGPMLRFKIRNKGSRTYYGSPITGDWGLIPHEALISITVGQEVK